MKLAPCWCQLAEPALASIPAFVVGGAKTVPLALNKSEARLLPRLAVDFRSSLVLRLTRTEPRTGSPLSCGAVLMLDFLKRLDWDIRPAAANPRTGFPAADTSSRNSSYRAMSVINLDWPNGAGVVLLRPGKVRSAEPGVAQVGATQVGLAGSAPPSGRRLSGLLCEDWLASDRHPPSLLRGSPRTQISRAQGGSTQVCVSQTSPIQISSAEVCVGSRA